MVGSTKNVLTFAAIGEAVLRHEITRSRKAAAEPIGVGFKTPNELTLSISSKPDPRLIALVRILTRQAARDFIQAAWDGQESAASRIKEGFRPR